MQTISILNLVTDLLSIYPSKNVNRIHGEFRPQPNDTPECDPEGSNPIALENHDDPDWWRKPKDGDTQSLVQEMLDERDWFYRLTDAVKTAKLTLRDEDGLPLIYRKHDAETLTNSLVDVDAVVNWLDGLGKDGKLFLKKHKAAMPEFTPAKTATPALEEPAQTEAEGTANVTPLPLTTSDIAFCFAGLRWNESQWMTNLGKKPKWLKASIVIPGSQGVSETRWSPVLIGAALVGKDVATRSVRARFQSKPLLAEWLDAWKNHESEYLTTD